MEYAIGSKKWPGLSKFIEEAGEALQVVGKIQGADGQDLHFDGSNLRQRLMEEISDVNAACAFVAELNDFDFEYVKKRSNEKYLLFKKWHEEQQNPSKEES